VKIRIHTGITSPNNKLAICVRRERASLNEGTTKLGIDLQTAKEFEIVKLIASGDLTGEEVRAARPELEFPSIWGRGSDLGDLGFERVLKSGILAKTRSLGFEQYGISDMSVKRLAESPLVANLEDLYLCNRVGIESGTLNTITDEGALAIARSPYLTNLSRLDLWRTQVGDAGFEAIIASANLTRLSTLTAWETNLTREGAARVKSIAGIRCSVETDFDDRIIDYYDVP
jgi:hypothetical protein